MDIARYMPELHKFIYIQVYVLCTSMYGRQFRSVKTRTDKRIISY